MNGDHPTSGDYAWAASSAASYEIDRLTKRVKTLEAHMAAVEAWSTDAVDAINEIADKLGLNK